MRHRTIVVLLALVAMLGPTTPAPAVVGGTPAPAGRYPWMTAIYAGRSPSSGQFCGGSLVAPSLIVTAAHCVTELENNLAGEVANDLPADPFLIDPLRVRLRALIGETRLSGSGGEQIGVRRVHVHPNEWVDIAVLELDRPSTRQPIDILRPSDASALDAPGILALVAGWGATAEGGSGTSTLREASVPIISDGTCALSYPGQISYPAMVCAGYPDGGTDTCQGDSGGPFMIEGPSGALLLAGATSWGDGCARKGKPGVYAEMRAAAAFIDGYR